MTNKTLTLADVLTGLAGSAPQSIEYQPISKAVIDSRETIPGALFVALPGENADGHAFVGRAFAAGAIAAIVEREVEADCLTIDCQNPQWPVHFTGPVCLKVENSLLGLQKLAAYWRAQFSAQVIGITGSVGKTSTKELTSQVLAQKYNTLKSQGNLNNEIGLPLTLLELNDSHEQVVLEMGMYDLGEIRTLCRIARPHIGGVTNIGPSHLERLGTIERIAQAKQELVEALEETGTAILNLDDPLVMSMRNKTRARVFTYGLSDQADLWADKITGEGLEGIRFAFHYQGEEIHARIPLLGRHSVHTALRAAATGLVLGLHWEEIMAGLQDKKAPLRLVAIPGPNGSIVLDDTYNASPTSTIAALNLLNELPGGRKIAVLGYMAELGAYEEEGHRKVGCRAADVADLLITLGPHTDLIVTEALACGMDEANIRQMESSRAVIDFLRIAAQPNDTILIKGSRSMAMETIANEISTKPATETQN